MCRGYFHKQDTGVIEEKISHAYSFSPPISFSISHSIYYQRLLWLASCDAVIISEYINVKPCNAFTALISKALHIIETVSAQTAE